ncbi:MAG TPA: hypothetical protein VF124_04685 [Gaiellaceae bacterium]
MRRFLFLLIGTAVLCVPAVSAAANNPPSAGKLAAQMCSSIRAKDGKATFKLTYHSFAGCLGKQTANAKSDIHNAAQTCKAWKADPTAFAAANGGKTFQQVYGTNGGNGKGAGANAMGKCVSTIAKQKAHSDVADTLAATATCKAMRTNDAATFQSTYGTGRNAFGKCVSKQANAKNG